MLTEYLFLPISETEYFVQSNLHTELFFYEIPREVRDYMQTLDILRNTLDPSNDQELHVIP